MADTMKLQLGGIGAGAGLAVGAALTGTAVKATDRIFNGKKKGKRRRKAKAYS